MHHKQTALKAGEAPRTEGRIIRWARWYDLVSGILSLGRGDAICRTTVEVADVRPGERVVDAGCGTGTLALALKENAGRQCEVTGIDASPEMIGVAGKKARRANADIAFQVEAIEALSFPDESFDLVTSTMMLHHLPEDVERAGLVEVYRVLKPGGRLLAVDFDSESGSILGHLLSVLGHKHGDSSYPALGKTLHSAGFTAVEKAETKHKQLMFVKARK